MSDSIEARPFGIYIHWPYCEAKCPYCDFNSHVAKTIDHDAWARAYGAEIERVADLVPNRIVRSVYFGGGTPSTMSVSLVEVVLDKIRSKFSLANNCEITLEANPSSVEVGKFRGFRYAGVNRISLGIQALNENDLRALGRVHTVDQAVTALEVARSEFDRVSFDLIYARQDQTLRVWEAELGRALGMAAGHLSLYQLTIEPETVFGRRFAAGSLPGLPADDQAADMYFLTQDMCDAAGYRAYEISNHALIDHDSAHNRIYWSGGDYAGIGPGAHGRLNIGGSRCSTETTLDPQKWLRSVLAGGSNHEVVDRLSRKDVVQEALLMGLRTEDGLDLSQYPELAPIKDSDRFFHLCDDGLVTVSEDHLIVSRKGRAVLNAIIVEIAALI